MLQMTSGRGSLSERVKKLPYHRNLVYMLFVLAIFYKLILFHSHLHALHIDMNLLDDIIAIGSIILVSFWTLWLPNRGRAIALGVLNVLLTTLIFSDLVYYRYFGDFITVPVLMQAGQVGELGDSIQSLIHSYDLWLIADWGAWLIVKIGVFICGRRQSEITYSSGPSFSFQKIGRGPHRSWLKRFSTGAAAFVIGFVLTMGPITFYTKTWAVGLFENNWWNVSLYNITGLLGFHYYDASRYIKQHVGGQSGVTAKEKAEIQQWFDQSKGNREVHNETYGAYAGSNVIVVQAEAFMSFMIGRQIEGQDITPNFNKLMSESLYFPNYYHQTGQGRTSDADFSSNSSLHPLQVGSVFVRYASHTFDTLPNILNEQAGYETGAFHAYEGSFWNRNNMYKTMGYDRFYSKKDFHIDEPLGWSLGDKSFFRQSLDYIEQEKQPFYSFLITLSSHHPYSLPKKVQELNVGEFEGTMFGDYLQSIHYTDAALGDLVEGLKQDGLWNNTIFCFYGDHDNSIKDKAAYEKFLGKTLSNLDMHQIMNQVAMLVHVPDGKLRGIDNEPAGQLDLAPSILHLLGIPSSPYYMMGNNLFAGAAADRLIVLRSGAFTDGKLYYIPSSDYRYENGSCYDLKTRSLTSVEQAGPLHKEASKRLRISDKVVNYDVIAELRKVTH